MPAATRSHSPDISSRRLRAARGQPVIIPAPARDFLAAAAHQLFLLQIMEVGIDAAFAKGQDFVGLDLDGLDDFVAVHFAAGKQFEDEQVPAHRSKSLDSIYAWRVIYLSAGGIVNIKL